MADPARARKLADRIKVIIAQTLDKRIKDPRLGFITVTDVRVTGDLQNATVYYTVFGDDEEKASTAAALTSATGLLRSEVGRQTGIRLTPTLAFVADEIPENVAHIESLLADARRRDADLEEIKSRGSYAGDSDPYRRPPEEEVSADADATPDAAEGGRREDPASGADRDGA